MVLLRNLALSAIKGFGVPSKTLFVYQTVSSVMRSGARSARSRIGVAGGEFLFEVLQFAFEGVDAQGLAGD